MKALSSVAGGLGILFVLAAVYGRFHGPPTLSYCNQSFSASTFLLAANTLLLIGILLALICPGARK